uniref:WRKY19-like zinc finger domain-containing protein n=1 Tax=Timema tahoe TaxID=61484 RepID=A0A7R9ITW5_9NEOP|nr:unnamed protein product [Timema tahoe]
MLQQFLNRDETDTSNSVHEIVKTEINLCDSSLGIMYSNIDNIAPVNRSKIKLEQDQYTSSSKILQSNILAQTSTDFNLNIECVNENQDLTFNSLQKKAEYRNILLNRSFKLKENIETEYKTSFLNSDQTNNGKEHQGTFSDNVYKTQACSDNFLTGEEFKDNVGLNMISCNHSKLGGFWVSTEATEKKYNLERYTNQGRLCMVHGESNICKIYHCSNYALKGGIGFSQGERRKSITRGGISFENREQRKCKTENCTMVAQTRGHCFAHGRGKKCKSENCTMFTMKGGNCFAHRGGRKCGTEKSNKMVRLGGQCKAHGGVRICKFIKCTKKAQIGGHCSAHGRIWICKTVNCTKPAEKGGHCFAHGGGRKCRTENCTKKVRVEGHCFAHGGGKKCKIENCTKYALKGGHCFAHGGGRKCNTEKCTKLAKVGGHCIAHGGGKICETENCIKKVYARGLCKAHGGKMICKIVNCSKYSVKGGHCFKHGRGMKF